jgi:hypothetical protein
MSGLIEPEIRNALFRKNIDNFLDVTNNNKELFLQFYAQFSSVKK